MKLLLLFSFLLVYSRPPAPLATAYYFSSISGNDITGNGSQAQPYATMTKLNTLSLTAGDNVFLERGSIFNNVKINSPGSGAVGNPVTIQAYGTGAKPVISGFATLATWTYLGANVWQTTLNAGAYLDLLTVGGVMRPMGRTPDAGVYFTINSKTDLVNGTGPLGKRGSVTSTSTPAGTTNWTNAEIYMRTVEWVDDRSRIASHTGNTMTYEATSFHNTTTGNKFFIQNDVRTLSVQNEWYYNPSAQTLRMWSTTDPGSLNVKAGATPTLLDLVGTSNVTVRNIKFQGADTIAINANSANNIKIVSCDFDKGGNEGISTYGGLGIIVDSCTINDMGNTGIVGRYTRLWHIRHNTITNCGMIQGMGQSFNQQRNGIMLEHTEADSTVITDNVVTNVGYCGIRFVDQNVTIARNIITNYCMTTTDGGGIYTNGNKNLPNTRLIAYNFVTGGYGNHSMTANTTPGGAPPIYLDDNSGNARITGNTLSDGSRYGIYLHNAADIEIDHNNIFRGGNYAGIGVVHDALGEVTSNINIHDNVIYSLGAGAGDDPPKGHLIEFGAFVNDMDASATVNNNIFAKAYGSFFFSNYDGTYHSYTLPQWRTAFNFDILSTLTTVLEDSMRLVSNATALPATINLGNSYTDLVGQSYPSSITLAPWSSKIMRKTMTVPEIQVTEMFFIRRPGLSFNIKTN